MRILGAGGNLNRNLTMPAFWHPLIVLWGAYLFLKQFYVFDSGLPQPADAVMVALIVALALRKGTQIPVHTDVYCLAAVFLCLVVVINLTWWSIYLDIYSLLSAIYYVYNFSIVLVMIALANAYRASFFKASRVALVGLALVQFVAAFLADSGTFRQEATLNDPNQLGYLVTLTACCLMVLKRGERLSFFDLGLLAGLGYVVLTTVSRSAAGAYGLLLVLALLVLGLERRAQFLVAPLVVIGVWFVALQPGAMDSPAEQGLVAKLTMRFEERQDDDSVFGRGYYRFVHHPEYVFFGAGEGALWRYEDSLRGGEIHSSFGTILFAYGVAGLAFFLALLYVLVRRASYRELAFLLPICLYGFVHQGVRFSMFWVFMGLLFTISIYGRPVMSRSNASAASERSARNTIGVRL